MEIGKRWRLARDKNWQEVEVGKRWRLARNRDWQEVEISKRWRLARDRDWQEVEVGKRWRLGYTPSIEVYKLLVLNNYSSHVTVEFINYAYKYKIILFYLPPVTDTDSKADM